MITDFLEKHSMKTAVFFAGAFIVACMCKAPAPANTPQQYAPPPRVETIQLETSFAVLRDTKTEKCYIIDRQGGIICLDP